MLRRLRGICVVSLLIALTGVHAWAAASAFSAPLIADGVTLGAATGALDVAPAPDGRVAWKLADGAFSPAALPDSTVTWNDANLTGSGTASAGEKVGLKEFEVTVRQSSGVDVSFRFRLSATLSSDKATNVSMDQLP